MQVLVPESGESHDTTLAWKESLERSGIRELVNVWGLLTVVFWYRSLVERIYLAEGHVGGKWLLGYHHTTHHQHQV